MKHTEIMLIKLSRRRAVMLLSWTTFHRSQTWLHVTSISSWNWRNI